MAGAFALTENDMPQDNDGRMSFDEAVSFVQQEPGRAAFVALPVFGELGEDAEQRAEGARVFIVDAGSKGSCRVRFIAGPFFSNAYGAHEVMASDEVPERVKEQRFLPTRVDESWQSEQIQELIQKLMQASGREAPQMPDYERAPGVAANPETVFPVSFIGRNSRRET
jgi:hypothetical protein